LFEGVIGEDLSNPIPEWAEHGADNKSVSYGVSPTMNTPWPDPGEELPHINTQLFGILDEGNRGLLQPAQTYNVPDYPTRQPTMNGFLTDYISVFLAKLGRQPTYDEYAQFMTGYTAEQMPVMSAIARGFATFDHWFCASDRRPSARVGNRRDDAEGGAAMKVERHVRRPPLG
jgi:phospholipase C